MQGQGHGSSANPDTDFSRVPEELLEQLPEVVSEQEHGERVRRRREFALARFGWDDKQLPEELADYRVTREGVQRYLARLVAAHGAAAAHLPRPVADERYPRALREPTDVELVNQFAVGRGYAVCEICWAVFWTGKIRNPWRCDDCVREATNGVSPRRRRDRIVWWAPEREPALQPRSCRECVRTGVAPFGTVGARSKTELCEACRKRLSREPRKPVTGE